MPAARRRRFRFRTDADSGAAPPPRRPGADADTAPGAAAAPGADSGRASLPPPRRPVRCRFRPRAWMNGLFLLSRFLGQRSVETCPAKGYQGFVVTHATGALDADRSLRTLPLKTDLGILE
jgi:hypothetical protein